MHRPGTMLLGALAAAEYFGGEIEKLTYELYETMNWKWFTNPVTKHPYLACYPEDLPKNVPHGINEDCLLYTSPSPRDGLLSRMPSSA